MRKKLDRLVALSFVLSTAALACEAPPPPDEPTQVSAALTGIRASETDTDPLDRSKSSCTCTKTFRSGRTTSPSTCDDLAPSCADLATLQGCDGRTDGPCDLPVSCDCDCTGEPYDTFDHVPGDGVYLTGLPDLYQFDYGCGADPNAIGCGPIAISMMEYAWSERGYTGLTKESLTAIPGQQGWRDLAKTVRNDMSGFCVPGALIDPLSFLDPNEPNQDGEFGVTQDELERELNAYSTAMGYEPSVSHYRVCGDCDVKDPGDLSKADGLAKITEVLEAGNPLIIGFDTGAAGKTSQIVDGEKVYTGNLSVGIGWINHYALITGYRHSTSGMDVIYMNTGLDGTPADIAFQWNPAGQWTHLFTYAPVGAADGLKFCPLDGDLSTYFAWSKGLQLSHAGKTTTSPTRTLTPLGGGSCGVVRDGKHELVVPAWSTSARCLTLTDVDKLNKSYDDVKVGIDDTSPPDWITPL
jgi:hypothetical protein